MCYNINKLIKKERNRLYTYYVLYVMRGHIKKVYKFLKLSKTLYTLMYIYCSKNGNRYS